MQSWTKSRIREVAWDCNEFRHVTTTMTRRKKKWLDASEVTFVDDMLSFLVCDTEDEFEVLATRVIECFEVFEMKANVGKLEIMVAAWDTGSKPTTRQVARGRLKFSVRRITIKNHHISQVPGYEE